MSAEVSRLCERDRCCGCAACAAVCAHNAIAFVEGYDGFLYPVIDPLKCVGCGRCERVCPVLAKHLPLSSRRTVAAQAKNLEVLRSSSSGGVFSLLAGQILKRGGVVYGAAFTSDFKRVKHCRVDCLDDLCKLRGSKYLQSDMSGVLRAVKDDLDSGKEVMFSGTPCQVAGLRAFLGGGCGRLVCVDVICHGVPSPMAWQSYLSCRKPVRKVEHRNKSRGWRHFSMALTYLDGTHESSFFGDNAYMRGFLSELFNRQSCAHCPLRGHSSGADITLGDFWGVEHYHPLCSCNDAGCSAVILQTELGAEMWSQVSCECHVFESSFESVAAGNAALLKDPIAHPNRARFFAELPCQNFDILVKKLTRPSIWMRGRGLLGRYMRKFGLR